ncbi:MAG: sterol desaturase family protein [Ferruginibacter sp.]
MQFRKIHNKGQAQLFKNRYLEYLTKSHPLVIWAMYIPIISWMIYHSSINLHLGTLKICSLSLAGIFSWSLFEYIIHRFVFHFIAESKKASKIVYIIHGNHHEYPRDKQRLMMPAVPSMMLAFVIFIATYAIAYVAGAAEYTFAFFPGFIVGYLLYGTMHYAIHACNPPFKWMKPLWRNHHMHHYKGDDKGFGVSSTLWDHVFGTMFDLKKEKEDKEKVQELMFISRPSDKKIS